MGFAEKIKQLRKESGLSQEELSVALNVGKSTISMYETGIRTPTFERLEKIADFFNVDMDELMGRERDGSSPIDKADESKPTEDDGLTKARRELIQFAKNVQEDQCGRVLQMMKLMLGDDQ